MLSRSRIVGIVTGGLLTTAMAVAPASASAGTPQAQAPRCSPATLELGLGPAHGAAGSVDQTLRFTNVGDGACAMVGFPGVSYVRGDAGNQVGAPAQRTGPTDSGVVLQPGETGHADVSYTTVENYPDDECDPTHVRGVRVYPPNDTSAMYVPRPGTGCADPGVNHLQVRAVQPGPGQ